MQQPLKAKILSCKVISLTHPLELKNLNSKIGAIRKLYQKQESVVGSGSSWEFGVDVP